MPKIPVTKTDKGKINLGGTLNSEQIEALGKATPSAQDILANMDAYNEEIKESYDIDAESTTEETPVKKTKTKRKVSQKRRKSVRNTLNQENEMEMDLDKELEGLNQQLENTQQEQSEFEAPPGMDMRGQILELLQNTPDAPNEQKINQWKAQHGVNAVHVMALGEGDVYIFTHLKRGQWKKIQEMITKIQESGGNADIEDSMKEKVIQHCMLWPKLPVEFYYNSRAGVVDSIYQVILLNSYFLSPQQAMLLTTQL